MSLNVNFYTTLIVTLLIFLIPSLTCGTYVGYTGPQFPRVSRKLISASQHPEVVTAILAKEVKLGRVAGPLPFPPYLTFNVTR